MCVCVYKGTTPQAEALARSIKEKLNELRGSVASALVAADKSGIAQTAHTVAGRLEQANKWLLNPQQDDKGLGKRAIALIIHEGKKVRMCNQLYKSNVYFTFLVQLRILLISHSEYT